MEVSKISDREGVGSLEITRVFRPNPEKWRATAAAQVVLPTPPFPPMRMSFLSS